MWAQARQEFVANSTKEAAPGPEAPPDAAPPATAADEPEAMAAAVPPPDATDAPTPTQTLERAQQESQAKEARVRMALSEQQARLREESARLNLVETELRKLNMQEQADVAILRGKIESADRDLVWLERDLKQKEEAHKAARNTVETLQGRKREMHEHLALMVLSSEKRKEEKLTELLARVSEHAAANAAS
ncbi:hypothetical protein M885DRAFT_521162 [Pelagophyceae sp. CCMP2097]|nr:hypothetical protein M885DRAFT_521162 [Pelagophyceae sp. CCMP2097]|mmetsp:Transcript_28693/g.98773  ORF Transcript_28693/g.98773 Transcript_28693/m.98773 type:complete len:191 (+) Transcript_28693:83-655(+)